MFDSAALVDAAAQLAGGAAAMLAIEAHLLGGGDLVAALAAVETHRRQLAAVEHQLVAAAHARGVAGERGCARTADLLVQLLRIRPGDAQARVLAATELAPRSEGSCGVLPPLYPQVAGACRDGSISPAHATVITTTLAALPPAVRAEHGESAERFLVEQARQFQPTLLAGIARRLNDTLNPDGIYTEEAERYRRRGLRIAQNPDGSARLSGDLDAICAEALLAVLDTLARPQPSTPANTDPSGSPESDAPGTDGAADAQGAAVGETGSHDTTAPTCPAVTEPDTRTPSQRRHDALRTALLTLLRSAALPACGGVAASIIITVTADQLTTGTGLATTAHGATIPVATALTLLPDAQLQTVALTPTREITAYSDTHRLFTQQQRLAMIARDQGCSFPGCTIPAAWCQSHHIHDYQHTHHTRIDDGTLLCGYHHREHKTLNWHCTMLNGTPHWTPPAWLDPTQTPRRNDAHHPTTTLAPT